MKSFDFYVKNKNLIRVIFVLVAIPLFAGLIYYNHSKYISERPLKKEITRRSEIPRDPATVTDYFLNNQTEEEQSSSETVEEIKKPEKPEVAREAIPVYPGSLEFRVPPDLKAEIRETLPDIEMILYVSEDPQEEVSQWYYSRLVNDGWKKIYELEDYPWGVFRIFEKNGFGWGISVLVARDDIIEDLMVKEGTTVILLKGDRAEDLKEVFGY